MSTKRRICPEAFKREAVDRVTSSGVSVEKVATEAWFARNGVAAMDDAVLSAGDGDGAAPREAPQGCVSRQDCSECLACGLHRRLAGANGIALPSWY